MVKTHRPSTTLFHWSHPTPSPTPPTPDNSKRTPPGSPSILDPFSPPIPLPDPTPIPRNLSRPPSLFSPSTTSLVSGTATTPRIILASPSTSTIHYLFPSSDTKSNRLDSISSQGTSTSSTSTPSLSRSSSTSRSSYSSASQTRSSYSTSSYERGGTGVEKRVIHDTLPLPPSRSAALGRKKGGVPSGVLSPAKRVVSSEKERETERAREIERGREKERVKKEDISGPVVVESGRDKAGGITGSLSMRTLRRQPSMADLTRRRGGLRGEQAGIIRDEGMKVGPVNGRTRLGGNENPQRAEEAKPQDGVRKKESIILQDIENRRERRGWEIGNPIDRGNTSIYSVTPNPASSSKPSVKPYVPAPSPTPIALRRRSQSLSSPRIAPLPPVPLPTSPILPAPDFGDPLSLADVLPSPSFSNLDYSTAGSTITSKRTSLFRRPSMNPSPTSIAMSRGDTRKGLGGYDSGKLKAREDAAKRLNGECSGTTSSASSSIGASIRRSVSLKRKSEDMKKARPRSQSVGAGVKSVRELDIGPPVPVPERPARRGYTPADPDRGIYLGDLSVDLGGRYGDTSSNPSPRSGETSLYPNTSPSSGFTSLAGATEQVATRVLRKPLHPALASPSDISLLAPTSIGLDFSPDGTLISLPESLEAEAIDLTEKGRKFSTPSIAPPLPVHSESSPRITLVDSKRQRRSVLLAQNTFYIPPPHERPELRPSKTMGPGSIRRAYKSANLDTVEEGNTPKLAKSPSILSTRRADKHVLTKSPPDTSRPRRPTSHFHLCSPPNAIDPLPQITSPPPPSESSAQGSRGLRSNRSSPFLSASASLRVIFGKEGFVARSLSQAFDQREKENGKEKDKGNGNGEEGVGLGLGLKSRISSPPEAGGEKAWRESVLNAAVTLSISSGLNKLGSEEVVDDVQPRKRDKEKTRMVSSGSKSRLAIPSELLVESVRPESEFLVGIGEAMLKTGGNSIDAGLNLKEVEMGRFVVGEDAPEMPRFGRTVGQIGKEESLVSDSVYSNLATTARESPKNKANIEISQWSPSPVKRKGRNKIPSPKPIISPPLPLFTPNTPSRLGIDPTLPPRIAPTPPLESNEPNPRLTKSRSKLFNLARSLSRASPPTRSPDPDTAPPPKTRSRGLTLTLTRSKTVKMVNPGYHPVSSDDIPPAQPLGLLDELTARDGDVGAEKREEEKVKKVLDWRSGVGENDSLRGLEERMARFVERERGVLRDIAKGSPRKLAGGGGEGELEVEVE